LKKVVPKDAKPQPKGQIAIGEQTIDQTFPEGLVSEQGPQNTYYGQQPYYNNQPAQTQQSYKPQHVEVKYNPDYTDTVEKQAVEEENARDAEAERSNPTNYNQEKEEHEDMDDSDDNLLGDLINPKNPLFGKYDVPSPTKSSVFCPPCGKN
jgi:hypothetical protein